MPELDFTQYEGREQAYVKHCLLEKYLPEWAYKTGSQWDGLVYIDGFAGPWGVRSEDLADSSFGVAVKALDRVARTLNERRGKSIQVQCVLVEQNESALSQLREFAEKSTRPGFKVSVFGGQFITHVQSVSNTTNALCKNPFKFVGSSRLLMGGRAL